MATKCSEDALNKRIIPPSQATKTNSSLAAREKALVVYKDKERYIFTMEYCISCYFREGFIFANFASQTLAKISTSIHVYL